MPAITLGLAEVEERLRVLRRRLNAFTLLHGLFLGLSALCLIGAAFIYVGLGGSVSAFRLVTWVGVVLLLGVVLGCVGFVRRRWLDIQATAQLADRRGRLTDRLTTLVDLRARPRRSRLAPVLVAQALALGTRWRPQHIAPRRMPRSIFLLIGSLLAFGASPLIAPDPPPPRPATVATTAKPAPDAAAVLQARPGGGGRGTGVPAGEMGSAPGELMPRQADEASPEHDTSTSLPPEPPKSESLIGVLPDKLQRAILSAFHAERMDRPQELAARSDSGRGETGERGDARETDHGAPRRGATEQDKPASQKGSGPGQQPNRGQSTGEGTQHRDEHGSDSHQDRNFEGASPAAGGGSSPAGLMDAKGAAVMAGQGGPKTFKLMITSFLQAVEQKGNQPHHTGKRVSTTGAAATAGGQAAALSDRQQTDDALRKAEIPPEYEDIVRRVYSARADQ